MSDHSIKKPWEVKTFQTSTKGSNPEAVLSIIEFSKLFPEFTVVQRVYWIENRGEAIQFRGGHYHPDKLEILWAVAGKALFMLKTSLGKNELVLSADSPTCLLIRPQVYHELWLEPGAIVAVASPEHYSPNEAANDDLYLEYKWE